MKTLVIGGTGTVGSQVVQELQRKQQQVRVLTTSASKAASLPQEVEGVVGDLNQPESLAAALDGIDRVFMVNQHTLSEVEQAQNAIAAIQWAGISKIVYQSIHSARHYQQVPHIESKVIIENAIRESGLSYVFVCPNNFYQNDLWFKEAIVQYGIYPQPLGDIGLSRNDVRDIAEVAVKALLTSELDGLSIPVVGPEVLNGQETARQLTTQLGFPVRYAGNDLISWAEQTKQFVPEWMVEDWTIMYRQFQARGLSATAEELALLRKVLGREPRSYASFLEEHKAYFQPQAVQL